MLRGMPTLYMACMPCTAWETWVQPGVMGSPARVKADRPAPTFNAPRFVRPPQKLRIGVMVPLASLLGLGDTPGELADRSGFIPGEELKQLIAAALDSDSRDQMLFTRLLTDDGGRLLDTTSSAAAPRPG